MVGGVIGAQFGTRSASACEPSSCASCSPLLVLAVCGKIAYDLVTPPAELFSLSDEVPG